LISITGAAQILVQAIGLIAGIITVRLLSVQEYALFTLANTLLGSLLVITDGGISNGVMALSGKVWKDPQKLGSVLATGLDLRKKFAIITLIISSPIIFYLLQKNNASLLTSILILLSLIPAFYASQSDSLLEIAPKLHQDINRLQKNQLEVVIARLILTFLIIFIFPFAFLAIFVSGISRVYGNLKLKKINSDFAEIKSKPDSEIRKEILKIVSRVLPNIIFFAFSSQIIVWILSIFGNSRDLASLGAIGRFSILSLVFTNVFSTLLIPRFSRLKSDRGPILKMFMIFQFTLILFSGFILLIVFLFPDQLLWILGKPYMTLSSELFLLMLSNCIGLVASMTGQIAGSKGFFLNPIILFIIYLTTIIISFFLWDLSKLHGILYYNILHNLVSLISNYIFSYCKLFLR